MGKAVYLPLECLRRFVLELPSEDRRGPICFDCSYASSPEQCNAVALCGIDEVRYNFT